MKPDYTYKELAKRFNQNLATLKRWGREFLPPDPTAGQQQGVARRLTPDEAFTLYLGGHLVSVARLPVPQVRTILEDLEEFLVERNLKPSLCEKLRTPEAPTWVIFVQPMSPYGFSYRPRGIIGQSYKKYDEISSAGIRIGGRLVTEKFIDLPIFPSEKTSQKMASEKSAFHVDTTNVKVLNLTELLIRFHAHMGVDFYRGQKKPRASIIWP